MFFRFRAGSGIRENSCQACWRLGILTNSATTNAASSRPCRVLVNSASDISGLPSKLASAILKDTRAVDKIVSGLGIVFWEVRQQRFSSKRHGSPAKNLLRGGDPGILADRCPRKIARFPNPHPRQEGVCRRQAGCQWFQSIAGSETALPHCPPEKPDRRGVLPVTVAVVAIDYFALGLGLNSSQPKSSTSSSTIRPSRSTSSFTRSATL